MGSNKKATLAVIAGIVVLAGVAAGAYALFGRGPQPSQYIGQWVQTAAIHPGGAVVDFDELAAKVAQSGGPPLTPWKLELRADMTGQVDDGSPTGPRTLTWEMHGRGVRIEAKRRGLIEGYRSGRALVLMAEGYGGLVLNKQ